MDFVVIQFLNGLASASDLFLVASGLSLIFGVTRIINFAHGSLYMLGAYGAYTAVHLFPAASPWGFWAGLVLAAIGVALAGAVLEIVILRRIYHAPELFQLLATFALALIVEDLVVLVWGPQDLLGPRAPGLRGVVSVMGQPFPLYDAFLIGLGPVVIGGLWLLLHRTRWGMLIRAASEDREMVAALGVPQHRLITGVFALGAFLAGLGGALQLPREAVHHAMDLQVIVEVFIVVVIGGLGSIPGAYLAAVLLGTLNSFGVAIFPQVTLILAFLIMAVVLTVRPWGLLGRPEPAIGAGGGATSVVPVTPLSAGQRRAAWALLAGLLLTPLFAGPYTLSVLTEVMIFALFAVSLHLMIGVAGMISFGHAAYFGLGAYGAALLTTAAHLPLPLALVVAPCVAALGAWLCGWLCRRQSGVYLAMLTLAFAQILWSIAFQWTGVTGGDNGILSVWPPPWLASPSDYFYLTLVITGAGVVAVRHLVFSPFGYALRACRDSAVRAAAIGIDGPRFRLHAFVMAGALAGLAGVLHAYFKGSVFPDVLGIPLSLDGLVIVLLGGLQTLTGPVVGAVVFKALQIVLTSTTEYWRMVVGGIVIILVVAFPAGIVGHLNAGWRRVSPEGSLAR